MNGNSDDVPYHRARAEAELRLARASSHPVARDAHFVLAGHHLDRAEGGTGLLQRVSDARR